ncbi:MAG: MSMEG_1061 family FMN-dependent PPOX-type flavoprotein [Dehalococcoidia bacterium]
MTTRLQPPTDATIESEAALREITGSPSQAVVLKKTDRIDAKGRVFLANSPFVCVAIRRGDGLVALIARGGASGFIQVIDDTTLLISDHAAAQLGDVAEDLAAQPSVGLLALIPGMNETLRINGRAEVVDGPEPAIRLSLDEMFYHCPKAFVRSHLWEPAGDERHVTIESLGLDEEVRLPALDVRCRALIQRSPFLFLGTSRTDGNADVSPRGDPAGFVRILDDRTLLLPDRRGNRLADSFCNILENPAAGLLFLVPGEPVVLRVQTRARVITDPDLLHPLTVQGKTPNLGLWLDVEDAVLSHTSMFGRARLWDAATQFDPARVPTIGELMVSQLACVGRGDGLSAELIDASLKQDAKDNLY